jgi:hypothetical protein
MNRRTLLGAAAFGTAGLVLPSLSFAQKSWPERPVRLIVPYPPGGATDVLARLYAEQMTRTLGQPVVIENRPGASGNIGIDAVAKAPADGYTIGAGTVSNFSINQYLYKNVPYVIERDLTPIALSWEFPNIAVVALAHKLAGILHRMWVTARATSATSPRLQPWRTDRPRTSTHQNVEFVRSRMTVEAGRWTPGCTFKATPLSRSALPSHRTASCGCRRADYEQKQDPQPGGICVDHPPPSERSPEGRIRGYLCPTSVAT